MEHPELDPQGPSRHPNNATLCTPGSIVPELLELWLPFPGEPLPVLFRENVL